MLETMSLKVRDASGEALVSAVVLDLALGERSDKSLRPNRAAQQAGPFASRTLAAK